jgi:hypothetical protein
LNEKFEAIDHSGLDAIEERKASENVSLSGENPAKNDEKDDRKMASKIGQPGQYLI